jgi:hypothetical protein
VDFENFINIATTAEQCWQCLHLATEKLVGVKLFTVTTVDMAKLLASRVYSSNPTAYPVSGTKPITIDKWFDIVHRQQRMFVANTIADIAALFPDHELISSLGCGSVVNVPVIVEGELAATINLLHQEHYYTPARVNLIASHLSAPSLRAYVRAKELPPR